MTAKAKTAATMKQLQKLATNLISNNNGFKP
jgi:hypothetical protein